MNTLEWLKQRIPNVYAAPQAVACENINKNGSLPDADRTFPGEKPVNTGGVLFKPSAEKYFSSVSDGGEKILFSVEGEIGSVRESPGNTGISPGNERPTEVPLPLDLTQEPRYDWWKEKM